VGDEAFWTTKEVANHLRVSVGWVYAAVKRGDLPAMRARKLLRFRPEDVRLAKKRREG
jgi:excisionase family DNA binding protein